MNPTSYYHLNATNAFLHLFEERTARGPQPHQPPFSCEICTAEAHQTGAREREARRKDVNNQVPKDIVG